MSQTSELTAAGRYIILAAAFLGWIFSGFQMAVMTLTARSATTEFLRRGPVVVERACCELIDCSSCRRMDHEPPRADQWRSRSAQGARPALVLVVQRGVPVRGGVRRAGVRLAGRRSAACGRWGRASFGSRCFRRSAISRRRRSNSCCRGFWRRWAWAACGRRACRWRRRRGPKPRGRWSPACSAPRPTSGLVTLNAPRLRL